MSSSNAITIICVGLVRPSNRDIAAASMHDNAQGAVEVVNPRRKELSGGLAIVPYFVRLTAHFENPVADELTAQAEWSRV